MKSPSCPGGLFLSLIAACTVSACRSSAQGGVVLARVGERVITDTELQRRIDEMPALVRPRYQAVEQRRELLEGLVRNALLLQEAERRHLESTPVVREQLERALD